MSLSKSNKKWLSQTCHIQPEMHSQLKYCTKIEKFNSLILLDLTLQESHKIKKNTSENHKSAQCFTFNHPML